MVLKTKLENEYKINEIYHTEHLLACKFTRSKGLIISQAGSRTYLNLCLAFHRLLGDLNNRSRFERMYVEEDGYLINIGIMEELLRKNV